MKFKCLFLWFFVICLPSVVFAEDIKRYYAVSEIGTTTSANSNSYTLTGNSWGVGLGYEVDKFSIEFLVGSAFRLKESYRANSYDYSFTTTALLLNYKIIDSGNFRPFVGIGTVGGNRKIVQNGATIFSESGSRAVYDLGIEIPLDDNSVVRLKYISTTKKTGYSDISSYNAGLLFRF